MADKKYRIPVLEVFPWQESVISQNQNTPPSPPNKGDRFLIPSIVPPYSDWYGKENQIAWFDGYDWHYDLPLPGWSIYVIDKEKHYTFNGVNWKTNEFSKDKLIKNILYVDNSVKEDGDGSQENPFSKINFAIQRIILNNDNNTIPYIIKILPGIYEEEIILEHENLYNIYFEGFGINQTIISKVKSRLENDNLLYLMFDKLSFSNSVILNGFSNLTYFCTRLCFQNCLFDKDCYFELNNICNCIISKTIFYNDIILLNIGSLYFQSDNQIFNDYKKFKLGNKINNIPISWIGEPKIYISCSLKRQFTWDLDEDKTIYVQFNGINYGGDGITYRIPSRVNIESISSFLNGNYISSGTLILNNTFISGDLTEENGIIDFRNQNSNQIYNNSKLPGKTLTEALDSLNELPLKVSELENKLTNLDNYDDRLTTIENSLKFDSILGDVILNPINN